MKKLSAQHEHLRLRSHPTNASTLAETVIVAGPTLIGCFHCFEGFSTPRQSPQLRLRPHGALALDERI
jgi:hypothetical protein